MYPAQQPAARDIALRITAGVAADLFQGRTPPANLEVATPFPPAFSPDERIWVSGPFRLQEFSALGDGSYEHSTTIIGGSGLLGIAMIGASAGMSAAGNRRRREAAAMAATPQWHDIDAGALYVSAYGMYLQTQYGLHTWDWSSISAAVMVGPGAVNISGNSVNGQISWILLSDWAELVFAAWAAARHPRHWQVVGDCWLPEEYRIHAQPVPPTPDDGPRALPS